MYLRGTAVVMMVIFHTVFALSFFGVLQEDVVYGSWRLFALSTATLFILLAGVSISISSERAGADLDSRGIAWKNIRRGTGIFLVGVLITVVSWVFVRDEFILFGVLHCIGLSIALSPLFLRFGRANLYLGAAIIVLGPVIDLVSGPLFARLARHPPRRLREPRLRADDPLVRRLPRGDEHGSPPVSRGPQGFLRRQQGEPSPQARHLPGEPLPSHLHRPRAHHPSAPCCLHPGIFRAAHPVLLPVAPSPGDRRYKNTAAESLRMQIWEAGGIGRKAVFTAIFLLLVLSAIPSGAAAEPQGTVVGYYFTGDGCPHCAKVNPVLYGEWLTAYPGLVVVEYEVYGHTENAAVMAVMDQKYGIGLGIPVLFFGANNTFTGDVAILGGVPGFLNATFGGTGIPGRG